MGKLGNNLSFLAIIIGVVLNIDNVKGDGGLPLQLTLVSIIINGIIGMYLSLQEEEDATMRDIQRTCKIITPALFTTGLWLDNDVLPDMWNYVPLVITLLVTFTSFLAADEGARARTIKILMFAHCAAQCYVAVVNNDVCVGVEAVTLLIAFLAYWRGEIVAGILPFAQYNYVASAFMIELSQCGGGSG